MFMAWTSTVWHHGNGRAIEVRSGWDARQVEDGRGQINVRGYRILYKSSRNPGTSDEERNSNILLKPTRLPGRQPVLTNVESIVGGIDDVCVVQLVTRF